MFSINRHGNCCERRRRRRFRHRVCPNNTQLERANINGTHSQWMWKGLLKSIKFYKSASSTTVWMRDVYTRRSNHFKPQFWFFLVVSFPVEGCNAYVIHNAMFKKLRKMLFFVFGKLSPTSQPFNARSNDKIISFTCMDNVEFSNVLSMNQMQTLFQFQCIKKKKTVNNNRSIWMKKWWIWYNFFWPN